MPDDLTFIDLGSRRLKDLTQPERVWQLTVAGLPSRFPPLNSLEARPNNLPVQPTALLGRERDLDELKQLIGAHRLLTVTGSGGVGKTRVALQLGADLIDRFPDGVWFADISPITDPALVASVVGSALGIAQVQGRRVEELIPQRVKDKKLLLIVDNCEHLLDASASLVDAIHRSAPGVRILATSRQALGIAGEATYRLPSLSVPPAGSTPTAAEAMRFGSVAVFTDRARLADVRFTLTDDAVPIVADICRRLDGIPLALELAAARVKVLSIPSLARRLDERFKLLTGGSRTALPRQKTLTALIDWSYDLLAPQEQLLFARLSVFAGPFDFDAAMHVCGGDLLDENDVLDLIASLADKSLVVADTSGERARYHLLESTRAYAAQKLTGAERDRLNRRHAEYFRDVVQAATERWGTMSAFAWLAEIAADLDNYRAALEWSLTQRHDDLIGAAIAGLMNRVWRTMGLAVEGRYWIGLAQERIDEDEQPRLAARLWRGLAHLTTAKAKVQAADRAIALSERLGDPRSLGWSLISRSFGLFQMGDLEGADAENGRALALFEQSGDRLGVASAQQQQASISDMRGETNRARTLTEEAIRAFRTLQNESGIALALGNLAEIEFKEGRPADAVRVANEAREIHRQGKDKHNTALTSLNLGIYRVALNDLDAAREAAREALALSRDIQNKAFIAIALQHLTLNVALRGEVERAARLLGSVDRQFAALGMEREITERWGYERLTSALRERLSDADIATLAAEGAAWSDERAIEEALRD